jgi:hypothetical protein
MVMGLVTVVLLAGLIAVVFLALRIPPQRERRVVYVQTSRDDRGKRSVGAR